MQHSKGPDVFAYAREGKLQLINAVAAQPGFDVNTVDDDERTMLHWAVGAGQKDVVAWLLERGARVDTKDDAGWSPIMTAASSGHLELLRLLWPRGSDDKLTATTSNGSTALVYAASKGHLPVVEFLLEQKVKVDTADKHGNTALIRAARFPAIVKTLLSHGASVGRANGAGETVLHIAAEEGNEEVCKVLLDAGANGAATNKEGKTPKELGGQALAHLFKK